MITCPERAEMLDQTVTRLKCTDWKGSAHFQMDTCVSGDPRARQTENVKNAFEWFLTQSSADFALVLEDDLDFNLHLRWNLERWSPILDERLHFGSLYNPNVRSLCQGADHFVADPAACYGSQAYLFSRHAIALVLQSWDQVIGMQDMFTFPRLYQQAVDEAADGDVLVEVGAWLGRSTAFLGEKAKASGKQIKVIVVDTFEGSQDELHMMSAAAVLGGSVQEIFERNMRLADVWEHLEIHEARSADAAAAMPDGCCAFVFIDADHRYDSVRADIRAWIGKVRPGGILAGHDCYTYATVYNAVRDELGDQFETTNENVWIHRIPRA